MPLAKYIEMKTKLYIVLAGSLVHNNKNNHNNKLIKTMTLRWKLVKGALMPLSVKETLLIPLPKVRAFLSWEIKPTIINVREM